MKILKISIIAFFAIAFGLTLTIKNHVQSQNRAESNVDRIRRDKFRHNGVIQDEAPASDFDGNPAKGAGNKDNLTITATEAPAGFDNLTNGFSLQGPLFNTINKDNVTALASFNDNRFIFEQVETVADGIGPTYNAQSCRECHENVVTGGASQVTVQRTGRTVNGEFFESLGGSLIHSRATYPEIVELVADADNTRTFRISPTTLGDGFVEAISNSTLLAIRNSQPSSMRGNAPLVPILEGNGEARIGRFGWKSQHASLESFSVDAYLNEMGITTPLLPEENTSGGIFVGYGSEYDPVVDPEDDGIDAKAFADFMRATKAPSRGAITSAVIAGERVFNQISCNVCHTPSITTAPTGTVINGNSFTIPAALGNKIIHPYSDFLLHDIGTGDGIPILPTEEYAITANQMRSAPLWGLRTRSRLMHDGLTFTLNDAILRHGGQASQVTRNYMRLRTLQKAQLIAFLKSL
ncbi:MAG TPA: di-heme oxidoredictase family protein [Pyrinomonadaceae bacterium]|jgi:CxxC motif-containing protein (DUF1111 family)